MSAALALDMYPTVGQSLQRLVPENTRSHLGKSLHSFSPLSRPETRRDGGAMSSTQLPKTLSERISGALWRRINSGSITRKHLQHALGVSAGTIDNLLSGVNEPSARVLMGLITFFDAAFCNEILAGTGVTVAKIGDARAAALRKVAEGMAELHGVGDI